jgi:hypothetical protein
MSVYNGRTFLRENARELSMTWLLQGSCVGLVLTVTAGCSDVPGRVFQSMAIQQVTPAIQKAEENKPAASATNAKTAKTGKGKKKAASPKTPQSEVATNKPDLSPPMPRRVGRAEEASIKKITRVINESLEVGPTLVLWIIDRTPSAREIVREVSTAAQNFYESPEVGQWSAAEGKPLLTAIATFDEQIQFVVDPPTSEWEQAKAGFDSIRPSSVSREMTFTAIKRALEKYLPLRTVERRELVLVVVTDEVGDDPQVVDELIETTRRSAIPVYVIGLPAPWGETNPFTTNPKTVDAANDDSVPTVGPESILSERVDIENWNAQRPSQANISLVDSGFGPFALERLCRASRGRFLALRPGTGSGNRGTSARTWPTGDELRFDPKVVGKYAPDYVSQAEYGKLLAENKARAVLCEAAQLHKVSLKGSPGLRFPKAAEAQMVRQLNQAQQFAALNSPEVDKLSSLLAQGEADRAKLTGPRWQAEFDLAIGRALANKARLDGYNSMIAALKRGKTFQDASSKEWLLESADKFETESAIKKLAEKATMYLERVIKEHPGTPWARIAEEELKLPLGWTWKEA